MMSTEELGQAWVGVRYPSPGYSPNVLASALTTDQKFADIAAKPVMCQEPSATQGITDFRVLGHRLQKFRDVDSCVSDAEYTMADGTRVHELNVVFAAADRNGRAVLVQLAGRAAKAGWASTRPTVQKVMESLTVTP